MTQIKSTRTYEVETTVQEVLKASSTLVEYLSLDTIFDVVKSAQEPTDIVRIPTVSEAQAYNIAWTLQVARPTVETVDSFSLEREGTKYKVRSLVEGRWECECGDFIHNHNPRCKHIKFVTGNMHDRIMDQLR